MNEESPVVLYTSPDGKVMVNAIVQNETLWITQAAMAQLFGVAPQNVTYHLKNIFKSGELDELSTCKEILQVQEEGGRRVERLLKHYSLDAIIAVGYRVDSMRATQFRIWATKVLKEFIIKGFALDDNRLKKGNNPFGADYFHELLERIRSIRASERRIWQQITESRDSSSGETPLRWRRLRSRSTPFWRSTSTRSLKVAAASRARRRTRRRGWSTTSSTERRRSSLTSTGRSSAFLTARSLMIAARGRPSARTPRRRWRRRSTLSCSTSRWRDVKSRGLLRRGRRF